MRRWLTALIIILVIAVPVLAYVVSREGPEEPEQAVRGDSCGVERWPVKTLSDRDAGRVDFKPVAGTVQELRSLKPPAGLPPDRRVAPTEITTFQVPATVKEFKLEDDKDIHVVITPDGGDPADTMIVELVDEGCDGAVNSGQTAPMAAARAQFVQLCGEPRDRFKPCSARVTVVGVGFFDVIHGQRGVAPNGIELHPVLGVTPVSGR